MILKAPLRTGRVVGNCHRLGRNRFRYVAQNSDLVTSHGTDQGSRAPPGTNSGQETPRSPKVLKDLNFSGQTVMLPEVRFILMIYII